MRLSVDHHTIYRFTRPQGRLVQMLRLTPENTHDQTIASWRIDVDCDARLRQGRDGFGNAITMLYVEGPVNGIEITVKGEVLTSHSGGVIHGAHETLPPGLFLRSTDATLPDPAIAAFAADAVDGARDRIAALHRLNRALHARFAFDGDRPAMGRTAAAAFSQASATPRDMAQMFAVAARTLGIPTRYVSGYHHNAGNPPNAGSHHNKRHAPTPHAWTESFVDGLGWVGFDPCTGRSPEERHIRVAIGLDAAGAAPVAGSRLGQGSEELDVDVVVHRED